MGGSRLFGRFREGKKNLSHSKIKVVRVISYLRVGGVEKRMFFVLEKLIRDVKFDISVICIHSKGKLVDLFVNSGIPVYLVKFNSRFDPVGIFKLVNFIKKEGVNIVHAHMYRPGISASVAAFISGVRMIYNVHNVDQWDNFRQLFTDRLLKFSRDAVVCVSRAVAVNYISNVHCLPEKVRVIYNGVEVPSCGNPFSFRKGKFRFLAVARLVPHKRIDRVISVFNSVNSVFRNVELRIVGSGPLSQQLKNYASDEVKFLGEVDDVSKFYAESDVLLLFSDKEGFANVILESMANYCVPVVNDVGGNLEAVEHAKTGVVVRRDVPIVLLKLVSNPKLMRRLSINTRIRVGRCFSLETMVLRTRSLYFTICDV